MNIIYGSYGIQEFSGIFGKKECRVDVNGLNRRITLRGVGKLNGNKLVIEKFSETEYVFHLKERLDIFYDSLINGALKDINKDTREELILEIRKTYQRLLDTVTPDKNNRITLPKEFSQIIPEDQNTVILKGNNLTASLFLNEDDYEKSIIR